MQKVYEKPDVAIDIIPLVYSDKKLKVFMMKRDSEPEKGKWSFVGGYVHTDDIDEKITINRIVTQKLSYHHSFYIEQLKTIVNKNRDPRGQVVSIVYLAYLKEEYLDIDENHQLFDIKSLNEQQLAFDHNEILNSAILRIKNSMDYKPNILLTLNNFELSDVINIDATVNDLETASYNRSNYRTKHEPLYQFETEKSSSHAGRPAKLYNYVPTDNENLTLVDIKAF